MWRYIVTRILDTVPTAVLVLTLVFVALRLLPGDPAVAALGELARPDQLQQFREDLGLNRPLPEQYVRFLWQVAHADFGRSMANNVLIGALLRNNLPYTMELALAATLIAIAIGIPIGVLSAVRRNERIDYAGRLLALIGFSMPDFYLGALLLIVFALGLGWFPIMGGGEGGVAARLHHLFLPALTLGLIKAAFLMRLTRSAMLEVLHRSYIRTGRSKGLSERSVLYRHALRNALLPVVTGLGIYMLTTLSGSITVELVFTRPGLGKLLVGAIASRDYALVQAGLIVFALFVVLVNLLVDLAYAVVDPRITYT
jgi:peptide/nickel transport system permease protein